MLLRLHRHAVDTQCALHLVAEVSVLCGCLHFTYCLRGFVRVSVALDCLFRVTEGAVAPALSGPGAFLLYVNFLSTSFSFCPFSLLPLEPVASVEICTLQNSLVPFPAALISISISNQQDQFLCSPWPVPMLRPCEVSRFPSRHPGLALKKQVFLLLLGNMFF